MDQSDRAGVTQAVAASKLGGLAATLLALTTACSDGASSEDPGASLSDLPYARSVVQFSPGASAGFGQDELPDVVLGPPAGSGTGAGSLDVLSLGAGGEIILGFGDRQIFDAEGPDFVVFENAFWPNGDASAVYAELGEVSVSQDGETWLTFACDTVGDGSGRFPGCAGYSPTLRFDPVALVPLDAELSGGDAFDLADVGLDSATFVKIRDLESLDGAGTSAGFDLDAVGILNQK
jgi:hypothetical protein